MKKKPFAVIGVICLSLGLVFMLWGCCEYQEMDGSVTKNMANCVRTSVEKVCKFNAEDSKEAQIAKNTIMDLVEFGSNFTSSITIDGVKIDMDSAKAGAVFDQVVAAAANGSCVALTNLQAALDFFDKLVAQVNNQKLVKGLKAVAVPDLYSLRIRAGLIK